MPQFKDAAGRTWHPRITCATLLHFEQQTGNSFFHSKISDLKIGAILLIAYLACSEERRKNKLTLDEFADAFDSDVLLQGMIEAMAEAIALFFQSRRQNPAETAKS